MPDIKVQLLESNVEQALVLDRIRINYDDNDLYVDYEEVDEFMEALASAINRMKDAVEARQRRQEGVPSGN